MFMEVNFDFFFLMEFGQMVFIKGNMSENMIIIIIIGINLNTYSR